MQKLEMLIKTADAHYDSKHQIQCIYLSCSLLNIARGTCNLMIVNDKSNFQNKITIKYERAVMSGSIKVNNDYFNTLQNQLSLKNERPARLELLISDKLNINLEEARKIQKNYFQEYNTTLNGMIKNHKIDADEFLEFVHDVDLSFLGKDKDLEGEIKKLDGKKIIFTNGSRAHALNVTKRIGIDKLFDGIFDIRDCEFIPKPSKEPYKKLVENYKIEPQYCIFFEDIARNLKPAFEMGMKTVWIKNSEPWASKFSDAEFVNYKTDKLANFLKEINENK